MKSGFHQILLAEKNREKFPVGNRKYEFCRLPSGLKNSPGIFQRAIDKVIREHIEKSCYLYEDDVIIFSEDMENLVHHIAWVLDKFNNANMRVSRKSLIFSRKKQLILDSWYLVAALQQISAKKKQLANSNSRLPCSNSDHFLASFYRCFIKDFALTAKPLADILKGDNGKVTARQSKKSLCASTKNKSWLLKN